MNYITQLQNRVKQLENNTTELDFALNEFRSFLHSPKFVGIDLDGERKDWISTSDVERKLQELLAILVK